MLSGAAIGLRARRAGFWCKNLATRAWSSREFLSPSSPAPDEATLTRELQLHVVIPEGTGVLTNRGGLVGVVCYAPSGPERGYRVRFADGSEESLRRDDLTTFKHAQAAVPAGSETGVLLRFVIGRCVVASTAYGLSQAASDGSGPENPFRRSSTAHDSTCRNSR